MSGNTGSGSTTASNVPSGNTVAGHPSFDAEKIRKDFPALDQQVHGHKLVYLDNAATTQKPRAVLDALESYYVHDNANVHRGIHELSRRATEAFEAARVTVASWVNAPSPTELIWTRGTTESLNLVASSWARERLGPGDEIVVSVMEHHSNLVPWQLAARRTGATLRFIPVDDEQRLRLDALDEVITDRTRIVAVGHVSNAVGTVNPVREIAAAAHAVGAICVIDGAQGAPHLPVDVQELECDFYAFSAHKMAGPTGIGALWGRRDLLQEMDPYQGGGEMISVVELERSTWADLPHKFEAGTPDIAGAVGFAAAVDYLRGLGAEAIRAHEVELTAYGIERLGAVAGVTQYGPMDAQQRSGVLSFNLEGVHPHDVSTILDSQGVAIRAGHHCAQPLMRELAVPATNRASMYVYNTTAEIDLLAEGLEQATRIFGDAA